MGRRRKGDGAVGADTSREAVMRGRLQPRERAGVRGSGKGPAADPGVDPRIERGGARCA